MLLSARIVCTGCNRRKDVDKYIARTAEPAPDGAPTELAFNLGPEVYTELLGPVECPRCGPLRLEVRQRWHGTTDARSRRQAAKGRVTVHGVPTGPR